MRALFEPPTDARPHNHNTRLPLRSAMAPPRKGRNTSGPLSLIDRRPTLELAASPAQPLSQKRGLAGACHYLGHRAGPSASQCRIRPSVLAISSPAQPPSLAVKRARQPHLSLYLRKFFGCMDTSWRKSSRNSIGTYSSISRFYTVIVVVN